MVKMVGVFTGTTNRTGGGESIKSGMLICYGLALHIRYLRLNACSNVVEGT